MAFGPRQSAAGQMKNSDIRSKEEPFLVSIGQKHIINTLKLQPILG